MLKSCINETPIPANICISFKNCIFLAIYTIHHFSGGWLIYHFWLFKSVLLFCSLNFIVFFPYRIKYNIMFIIIVFKLGNVWPSGFLFFVPALLLSILAPLYLHSSSVSLYYFILGVPIRQCLEKHSCMSFPFPIAILNGIFFFALWKQWIIINWALLNKF